MRGKCEAAAGHLAERYLHERPLTATSLIGTKCVAWEPRCECGTSDVRPCVVLDPFAGSGTTLMVAKATRARLRRHRNQRARVPAP